MKIKITMLVISIFFCLKSSAQKESDFAVFFGKLDDSVKRIDSVRIAYSSIDQPDLPEFLTFLTVKETSGKFTLKLPIDNKPIRLLFMLYRSGKPKALAENWFFAEHGDSIKMEVFKNKNDTDSIAFRGRNSAKYILSMELNKEHQIFWAELKNLMLENHIEKSSSLNNKLTEYASLVKKFSGRKEKMIKELDPEISSQMRNLLRFKYANYYYDWHFRMHLLYSKYLNQENNAEFINVIKKQYDLLEEQFTYKFDSTLVLASGSLRIITDQLKYHLLLKSSNDKFDLKTLYGKLKSTYTGRTRERLLFDFFTDFRTLQYSEPESFKDYYGSLLDDALSLLGKSDLLKYLVNKVRFNKGTKFFDTEFIELNGERFDTKFLRGKIFLLDMWNTGCTGCVQFHNMFKNEVYPKIGNKQKFVYLSVSTDRTMQIWKKALTTDRYTSDHYKNVFTGDGITFNHPLIKHYYVDAYPFILLVDTKGKVIARIQNGQFKGTDLLKMINDYLDKSMSK